MTCQKCGGPSRNPWCGACLSERMRECRALRAECPPKRKGKPAPHGKASKRDRPLVPVPENLRRELWEHYRGSGE
jgi:hypothetical protein